MRVVNEGIDLDVHDGRLRPAIGIENIQVMRANRTHPELADRYGWTYNHAPMLAYWNGKFYLEYLSNPFGEHLPPGQTLVATSTDGRNWEMPKRVFPRPDPGFVAAPRQCTAASPASRRLASARPELAP